MGIGHVFTSQTDRSGQMKIRTQYIMSILGILAWHCKRQQLRFGCDESMASGAGQLLLSRGSWFPQEQNKVEVTDLQNSLRLAQEEAGLSPGEPCEHKKARTETKLLVPTI